MAEKTGGCKCNIDKNPLTAYGFSVVTAEESHMIKSMGRIARVVIPGVPNHVTQRWVIAGWRCFSGEDDYRAYLDLIFE